MLKIDSNSLNFKAASAASTLPPQMYAPRQQMSVDTFSKKEKNKEKWQKAGVIAQIGLAAAFGVMALMQVLTHKVNKKAMEAQTEYFKNQGTTEKVKTIVKNLFEDLGKADNIESLALTKNLSNLEKELTNCINNRETVLERGGDVINSILFYGPPGTGKTTIAKAIAKKFKNAKFVSLDVTKMKDKYVGETEKNINALVDNICAEADKALSKYNSELGKIIGEDIVKKGDEREILKAIQKAKKAGKIIPEMERIFVFMDEIDSVMMVDTGSGAKISNDMLNEFKKVFTEKLGKRKNIITMGATNLEIDAAKGMTKDGKTLDKPMLDRFARKVFVGNPKKEQMLRKTVSHYKGKSLVTEELQNEGSERLKTVMEFLEQEKHGTSFRTLNSLYQQIGNTVKEDPAAKVGIEDMVSAIWSMKESMKVTESEFRELLQKLNINPDSIIK